MRWVGLVGTLAVIGSLGLAGCDGDDHKNQAPVAHINASPLSGPTPLVVTLDASASTDKEDRIESYAWVTGDGGTLAGVTVTHIYERPGEFTVTLTVTDHKAKTSTASQVVTVENRPPVAAFTATPESGTAPLVVVFDASTSNDPDGSIEQYAWEFPGGTATGAIVEHRFEEPGEFEVTLRVVDDFGASDTVTSGILVEELPVYQMISLGTLNGLPSAGLDINERGEVAGQLYVACSGPCGGDIYSRVFLYRDREMIDIGTLGGAGTRFGDLNNLGQITGASQNSSGAVQAFLYSNGEMVALPPFPDPFPEIPFRDFWQPPSEGLAINDRGEIVGNARVYGTIYTDVVGCQAGFLWGLDGLGLVAACAVVYGPEPSRNATARLINESGSVVVDSLAPSFFSTLLIGGEAVDLGSCLDGKDVTGLRITDLNDHDSVVGAFNELFGTRGDVPFLSRNGDCIELPAAGDASFYPRCVNNLGHVVGSARDPEGHNRAYLYSDGAMIDLGALGGGEVWPVDLNDAGDVTGGATTESGDTDAFVYSDGQMIDLGTLGGCCSSGSAINNLGQVTGDWVDADGQRRAFLATPIRLLLARLAEEVRVANVDTVLAQTAEAARDAYAARDGRQSCSALAEFRTRVTEIREVVLGAEQAAIWMTKSQEISDALHCS